MYFKSGLGDGIGAFCAETEGGSPSPLCRVTVLVSLPEEPGEPAVGVKEPSAFNLEWLGTLSC